MPTCTLAERVLDMLCQDKSIHHETYLNSHAFIKCASYDDEDDDDDDDVDVHIYTRKAHNHTIIYIYIYIHLYMFTKRFVKVQVDSDFFGIQPLRRKSWMLSRFGA